MTSTEKLPGQGEVQIIRRQRVRRVCGYCGEDASYKNTYLDDGDHGARYNPRSSAFGRDDCTWCSDFDDFLCSECHERGEAGNAPDGYNWCSTFHVGRFPQMFLVWQDTDITGSASIDIVFDGPPGPESGRFIEAENLSGESINAGEWIDRGDGMWALRVPSIA